VRSGGGGGGGGGVEQRKKDRSPCIFGTAYHSKSQTVKHLVVLLWTKLDKKPKMQAEEPLMRRRPTGVQVKKMSASVGWLKLPIR
jgi:hypothetical protein